MTAGKALAVLRRRIRSSARRFRAENDNSKSLFHPEMGFTHAYDIEEVELALDAFEESLETEFDTAVQLMTPAEYLRTEAEIYSKVHSSANIRAFARDVLEFLETEGKGPAMPAPVLELVRRDSKGESETQPEG